MVAPSVRWVEIERLLDCALGLAPEDRKFLIQQVRSDDPFLGAEFERLLSACEAVGGFLEEPAAAYAERLLAWAAEQEPLAAGTTFGPYEIVRRLGRGATATVYLARDPKHRRSVAIKVLHPELAEAVGSERFLREIEIAATLQHPHILPLFDSGAIDGLLFYVMPHVEGESLRGRLVQGSRMPVDQAVRIACEVADALDYSHRHGVVHRDIKPENILLQDGQAIVADFGIARAIDAAGTDRSGESATGTGTPAYMSPEQASPGCPIDGRTDIYSLGCVLYEMLAGAAPFIGDTPREIAARHTAGPPPRLRVRCPAAPPAIERAVVRALAKTPSERFHTAGEFADALVGGGRRATARPRILARPVTLALSAGILALASWATALWLRSSPFERLDPNLVAVAPFDVLDPRLALWHEGLVDLLSRNLDGAGPLRTVSPTVVVRRWSGRSDPASAATLGHRTGASMVIFGQLLGARGDSVRLRATLLDVAGNRTLSTVELRDLRISMDRLTDSLTVTLLRELGRRRPVGVVRRTAVGSTSLEALKAFLQGEQFYRRAVWDSAVVYCERAIALDTTFALALHRLSAALVRDDIGPSRGYAGSARRKGTAVATDAAYSLSRVYALRAGALNHGLAPRESLLVAADSLFASVLDAPKEDTAASRRQRRLVHTLEEATRRYPEDPEMWHLLGDARFHFGWLALDSAQRTLDAFDQAIALDSAFAPSYIYAIELAGRLSDAAAMRRYAAAYVGVNPANSDFRLIYWLLDPIRARSAETRRALEMTAPGSFTLGGLNHTWHLLQTLSDSAEVAVRVARQIRTNGDGARANGSPDSSIVRRRLLAATLAYRGHLREANQILGREDHNLFVSLFAELSLEGGVPPDTAAAVFDRWLDRAPFWPAGGLVFALPWWATRGDTSALLRFASRADSARAGTAVPGWAGGIHDSPGYAAAAARAYLALARRDTAGALLRLASLPLAECEWCFLERLTYARLLEARGRDPEALSVLGAGFPMPFAWPTRPLWMLERARVASRLGDREKAVQSYQFVADVWRGADSVLQPYVAEAHAALDR